MKTEQAIMATILDFCRERAIVATDADTAQAHEEGMWRLLKDRFGDSCEGDVLDLFDDYYSDIKGAMFRAADILDLNYN